MTLLIREDLTDADLAWAAQSFAPRDAAAVAAPPSPTRSRTRTLMGLGSLAAAAGLALALSANVGATAPQRAPDTLAGVTLREAVAPGWTVQASVQDQLRAELTGTDVAFSLLSAQATRLDQGGRRFDGAGLARLGGHDTRFVAFTLSLDPDGRVTAFHYGLAAGGETDDVLAVR
ncbi:hypothetical protein [Arenimonas aestuarii]